MGTVRQVLVLGQGPAAVGGKGDFLEEAGLFWAWLGKEGRMSYRQEQCEQLGWEKEQGTQETCFLSRELPGRCITYFAGG